MATWHSCPPVWLNCMDGYSNSFPHNPGSLINDLGFYIDPQKGLSITSIEQSGVGSALWGESGRSNSALEIRYGRWGGLAKRSP